MTHPADPFVLRAEGIGKRFAGHTVLKSASIWAERGRITTLLGRNGSGKTTLMRVAAGTLKPDWGTVRFRGRVHARMRLAGAARRGLMYVPQGALLSEPYRVRDHVAAFEAVWPEADLPSVVERFGVAHTLDQRAWTLSGGERMRVSVAMAVARRAAVLLIDEPFVGIQPKDQELVATALREAAEGGTAVVTSGHDTRILMDVSDTILWSTAGTTHHLGTPAEARATDQFVREYLGPGW